jgi:ATP-dependent protease ClpP protease subunit
MPITTTLDAAVPVIRLTGEIEMPVAYSLIDEIKLLHGYYQVRTIDLHIDSLGGSADALRYIVHSLDAWRNGEGRVLRTFGINEVASAAAMLLSLGTFGHRTASKRSRLLYHSVRNVQYQNTSHTAAQLSAVKRRLERWDHWFVDMLAEHTKHGGGDAVSYRRKVTRLLHQERFISPEQAMELKLIDRVCEAGAL